MALFAKLDENNFVIEVNVVNDSDCGDLPFPQSENVGIVFLANWSGGYTNWRQTSQNGEFRRRCAGIGYTYNAQYDAFITPQPYPSWIFNTVSTEWDAPVPMPQDGKKYVWDEAILNWVEV